MSATPPLDPQLIGQTEKSMNAILARLLAGTGLTEPQWVTLTLTVTLAGDGALERDQLVRRVAAALKLDEAQAQVHVEELARAQLLRDGAQVAVTDHGQRLQRRIRAAATEVTERLWGDLAAEELAIAARVLNTIRKRADAELGNA